MPTLNKKIIISLLLAVVVVGGSGYYRFVKDRVGSLNGQLAGGLTAGNEPSGAENFLQGDADQDGLKYWEEALWGTDPDNQDTDGDGTPDGEEIKEGRLPTLAGPDDRFKTAANPGGTVVSGTAATSTENSLTDSVARDLYANYAVLGQSGELTPENQAKLTEELNNSVSKILEPKTYSLSDIKVTASENTSSIKEYGNDVVFAINTNGTQKDINAAIALTNYLDKGDKAEMQKIVTLADDYKKILSALLKLPAPDSAAEEHLALINAVGFLGKAIEGMTMVDDDPIIALVSIGNFREGEIKISDALGGLISYFKEKQIVFTSKDYGYIFEGGI